MNAQVNRTVPSPGVAVQALVAEYGIVRVALALAAHIARRRGTAERWEADLSNHVRRDIGLGPLPQGRRYWEL